MEPPILNEEQLRQRIEERRLKKSPFLLGICGYGGSGKSTLCRSFANAFPSGIHFETDWYARYPTIQRRQRIKEAVESKNPERIEAEQNPMNWYDWDSLAQGLSELCTTGKLFLQNAWNQKTGEKDKSVLLEITKEDALIIVDGIYLLHDQIRHHLDEVIFVDTPLKTTFARTRERDQHRSSPEYLAYKEGLVRQYDEPYMNRYRNFVTIFYKPDNVMKFASV